MKILAMMIAVVLLVMVVTIWIANTRSIYGRTLSVGNLEKAVNALTSDQRANIEHQLYDLVEQNSSGSDSVHGAMVRESSIVTGDSEDGYYLNFAVDIDSIRQSYYVQIDMSAGGNDTGYPILVTCIYNRELVIYQDFSCVDDFSTSANTENPGYAISQYLPANGILDSGLPYEIEMGYSQDDLPELKITADNCGDQSVIDQLVSATRDYVLSNGLNPDDYDYYVPLRYNNCTIR